MHSLKQSGSQAIQIWLASLALLIVSIILLGGYTRLSGSGLSIVQWQPITGVIPPLNHTQWLEAFEQYKLFPEFQLVNYDMSLSKFKFIFMVEFLHRLLARILVLVFLLPLLYFYRTKKIPQQDLWQYILMLGVLASQGCMGWYMVKSGLIKDPSVSHYRLSAHLMIAIALYSMVFYKLVSKASVPKHLFKLRLVILLLLTYLQTFIGALVAGLKAGLIYNTFPLMGNAIIPYELSITTFHDPVTAQFVHRQLAYGIFIFIIYISYLLCRSGRFVQALLLILAGLVQILLGIITLLWVVPLSFALLHQLGAVALISVIIFLYTNDRCS